MKKNRALPATLAAVLVAIAAADPGPSSAGDLPPVFLWAWARAEDLRFIDPRHTGVAFLASTIHVNGPSVSVKRRRQPLHVPAGTRLIAVAHFVAATPDAAALGRAAEAVLELSRLPGVGGVQLDFEATPSQRRFYQALARRVRDGLPQGQNLSATALASWCLSDRWLDPQPFDEVIPMLFSMGRGDGEVRAHLEGGRDFIPAYCRTSVGVSMQETFPRLPPARRTYAFNAHAWRAEDYRRLLKAVAQEPER